MNVAFKCLFVCGAFFGKLALTELNCLFEYDNVVLRHSGSLNVTVSPGGLFDFSPQDHELALRKALQPTKVH